MHPIAFGTKRVFHGFVRVTRKALATFGLTAARFDMLSALHDERNSNFEGPYPMTQSDLRRKLGVSAPVVSRMLRALEDLGLLDRCRSEMDARHNVIELTDEGIACIREARRMLLRRTWRVVVQVVWRGWQPDAELELSHVRAMIAYLGRLRLGFADEATLAYPLGDWDD